ncbi:hypothetical protein [Pseudophaeobacter flagellatus]|uniref:hypothetical protein n=1 Tax=Pseudophaeobacter flagellatus TaxID=2899119 RepID=UPI001E46FFDD|nr:hypothetical protein [Pseudophaeobacter flagellatus]MCD9149760.1 hypothetical protein [Pseudophaeobacter flagellatus]
MREPVQWLGSWFRYRQRPALQGRPNSAAGVSFNDFVSAYLSKDRPAYANIAQQSDFITDKNGALLVDHLYFYSDLPAALQFLEKRLQQTITLPLVNKSPQRGGEDMSLSPELTAELHRANALDFEIYEALQSGNLSRLR